MPTPRPPASGQICSQISKEPTTWLRVVGDCVLRPKRTAASLLRSGLMAYLKSALVGIVTGVGTAVIWVFLRVFITIRSIAASESGGLGSVSGGMEDMLMPGIVGFALGFYLMLRRQRARTNKL